MQTETHERFNAGDGITGTILDWDQLGRDLNQSALDAHGINDMPSASFAYQFLLDNPECFGYEEWPTDMPKIAPGELVSAYCNAGGRL